MDVDRVACLCSLFVVFCTKHVRAALVKNNNELLASAKYVELYTFAINLFVVRIGPFYFHIFSMLLRDVDNKLCSAHSDRQVYLLQRGCERQVALSFTVGEHNDRRQY